MHATHASVNKEVDAGQSVCLCVCVSTPTPTPIPTPTSTHQSGAGQQLLLDVSGLLPAVGREEQVDGLVAQVAGRGQV